MPFYDIQVSETVRTNGEAQKIIADYAEQYGLTVEQAVQQIFDAGIRHAKDLLALAHEYPPDPREDPLDGREY